jgi:hypothetical protein
MRKKMNLLDIFESIFHPELPNGSNSHMFIQQNRFKGPSKFPYNEPEESMDDEDINKELKLEFKTGRVMKDPTNLPNHNLHNGSFSNGKGSKAFASYQTDVKKDIPKNDELGDAESISIFDKEKNSDIPQEWKKYFENQKIAFEQSKKSKPERRSSVLWDLVKPIKKESVGVGTREKARAYGSQITTKQPFSSGMPNDSGNEFMSDEEISKELGLSEWISSNVIFNNKVNPEKADLNFFEKKSDRNFEMNTEEDFNETQRKVKKRKKRV